MTSNFHYPIDLNEVQNHQSFFCALGPHQASSSSSSSSSLSYLPFFQSPEQHGVHTYHADHHSHVTLETNKMFIPSGGSCNHTLPKKEPRLKLTIRKKEERSCDQNGTKGESSSSPTTVKWMPSKMRLMKKMITSKGPTKNLSDRSNSEEDFDRKTEHTINENGFGNNSGVVRVCSDCNTTKTPLWRSGPRGPKSLCNACGIRQRKARRAAMAAAAAAASAGTDDAPAALPPRLTMKKKMQNKNKRSSHSNGGDHVAPPQSKTKKCKITADSSETQSKSSSSSSSSSNKLCFDDLTIILSKSSAFQQVFPQDEKEAAILLMALSYGMVHG